MSISNVDIFLNLRDYTALLLTIIVLRCRNRSESFFTKLVDLDGLTTNKLLKISQLKTAIEVSI